MVVLQPLKSCFSLGIVIPFVWLKLVIFFQHPPSSFPMIFHDFLIFSYMFSVKNMGYRIKWGIPLNGWFIKENPAKHDENLGYPHFEESPSWKRKTPGNSPPADDHHGPSRTERAGLLSSSWSSSTSCAGPDSKRRCFGHRNPGKTYVEKIKKHDLGLI